MSPDILQMLIPIVAILATFGFPVALVFVFKYFKLKDRELQLEADAQKWVREQHQLLESRVQRLESVVLSLDRDVRGRLGAGMSAELTEGPATSSEEMPGGDPARLRQR